MGDLLRIAALFGQWRRVSWSGSRRGVLGRSSAQPGRFAEQAVPVAACPSSGRCGLATSVFRQLKNHNPSIAKIVEPSCFHLLGMQY